MKAGAVRSVANAYSIEQIDAGIEAITEREEDLLEVDGEDMGERLTHLLLGRRVRTRIDAGEDEKAAFRAEMGAVRGTLKNE
ncbi:MAG: hypothetical protein ACJAZO_002317 [Myxococcota bacterium]|jgi:hypothetical protein